MADYSHEIADDGFHEIQLSGKQIVFLVMAATVASAVIFLCGVLVGRGVHAQRVDVDTEAAAAATPAPPVADAGSGTGAPAEPPAAPAETPDELSYLKRLQGETTAPETLAARDQPAAQPVQQPPATQPSTPQPEQASPPAPKPAAATQPASPPPAAASVPTEGKAGGWVVQVTALSNQSAAQDVVRQLSAKGYPAFLVKPGPGMPAIYRVQVGGYGSRGEADQVARRIEKEERLKPVVRQNR